jgi:ATP/maltotriose-dependent transcriptional regulator MalT
MAEPLTRREIEVLELIAAGLANRDIAQKLVVALPTVKKHLRNIYEKLDVNNRSRAIIRAHELGLLKHTSPKVQ